MLYLAQKSIQTNSVWVNSSVGFFFLYQFSLPAPANTLHFAGRYLVRSCLLVTSYGGGGTVAPC